MNHVIELNTINSKSTTKIYVNQTNSARKTGKHMNTCGKVYTCMIQNPTVSHTGQYALKQLHDYSIQVIEVCLDLDPSLVEFQEGMAIKGKI